MSTRHSDHERVERDTYLTPPYIVDCLIRSAIVPHVLWEPAEGEGALSGRLKELGFRTYVSDLATGSDFLQSDSLPMPDVRGIVTNPPFNLAQQFIEKGLQLLKPVHGFLALLLPTAYDHAATRRHLFRQSPQFTGQIKLLRRIVWFEREDGQKAAPSEWHSWFVWSWQNCHEPWVRYETWPD